MTGARILRIGRIACTGQGLCAELLPEFIDLDEWGCPILKDRVVPDGLRPHARRAVAACPLLALHADDGPVGPARAHRLSGPGAGPDRPLPPAPDGAM
jgi:ferredoxin